MQENENIKLIKMLVLIAIYAVLTWLWFDLKNSNDLALIGQFRLLLKIA
ncbi:MAG: hypothetical protein IJ563_04005 [Selenomonadaceae bacterium]|nr:hypothetical protein [Selenomonadaceae bacterium]